MLTDKKMFKLFIFDVQGVFLGAAVALDRKLIALFSLVFSGKRLSKTRCSELILRCYFIGYLLRLSPCQQEVYQLVSEAEKMKEEKGGRGARS